MYLEEFNGNTLPILAICDGKDPKHSRLIGSVVHDNWFTTLEAVFLGVTPQTTIKSNCHRIIQEHIKRSGVQEHDVCSR